MRRLVGTLLIAATVAGCGGGTASAPTTSTGNELTVGDPAGGATSTSSRPDVPFPATTAEGVLALAALRPTGKTTYAVTIDATGSSPAARYDLVLASNDVQSVLHQSQATGDLWVGFDIAGGRVAWTCTAPAAGDPVCHDGDTDGSAGRAAAAAADLLGNDVIVSTFAPLSGAAGAGIGPDDEVGMPVSCLAGTLDGSSRRLCVARTGTITEMASGGTRVLATAVATAVSAGDLDPPAPSVP